MRTLAKNWTRQCTIWRLGVNPTNIYLFIVNDRNTSKMCEICAKLTIKTPERRPKNFTLFSSVSIVDFEQLNICWEIYHENSLFRDCNRMDGWINKSLPLLISRPAIYKP